MTIEEIRRNAPDGANRYYQCGLGVIYFKKNFINWSYWCEYELLWFQKKFDISFRLKTKPL